MTKEQLKRIIREEYSNVKRARNSYSNGKISISELKQIIKEEYRKVKRLREGIDTSGITSIDQLKQAIKARWPKADIGSVLSVLGLKSVSEGVSDEEFKEITAIITAAKKLGATGTPKEDQLVNPLYSSKSWQ